MSVDPGKSMGVAVFLNGNLTGVNLIKSNYANELQNFVNRIQPKIGIVEAPRIYGRRQWKGDPNDLIKVALLAGMALAALSQHCIPEIVYPSVWKGQRPKDVDNKYTLELLSETERVYIENSFPKSKLHNVIDAIGIGLWKLGRR
jgi:hypothetical protein